MIRIVTVQFDYDSSNIYKRLKKVLHHSIQKNIYTDDTEIVDIVLPEPSKRDRVRGVVSNTDKLYYWQQEVQNSDDGDYVILLDCDMMVLQDPCVIFKKDFDIAYTERDHSSFPINGGVIFVKINKRSRDFFELFFNINNRMYSDYKFHQFWRNKYAGINQSAFGYLIDKEGYVKNHKKYTAKLISVPCREWNVCQDWDESLKDAKIIHVKGALRKAIFSKNTIPKELQKTVELWRQYQTDI